MDEDYEEYEYEEDYTYEDDGEEEEEEEEEEEQQQEAEEKTPSPVRRPLTASGSHTAHSNTSSTNNGLEATGIVVPHDGYTILRAAEIRPLLESLIAEISVFLDVSAEEAQALLQSVKWNKERLLESYFSDAERARKAAGLSLFRRDALSLIAQREGVFTCTVCYEDRVPFARGAALGCDHAFCRECYGQYLSTHVSDGPACVLTHCPQHKCKELVTASFFHTLTPPADAQRYDEYVLRNFVEMSKYMKYCPAPRCDRVSVGQGVTTIQCTCGNCYCFRCGEEAHDPCSCAQLAEWAQKCSNESETANWILANTRKCPHCNTRIEKNQGCNHMTCKVCKFEFCWICMGNWVEHNANTGGYYKCNRYDPATANTQVSAAQKAKAELDRYLHYYQRYHGHEHALKFASLQREQTERKMLAQQESQQATWVDVEFLKQATEQLIQCRRVLKYTYVMGYFLKENTPEKTLFEHHQEMLEKNTERLHEYTEQPIEKLERTQVINLARVTEKFMHSLLDSLSGGIVRIDDAPASVGTTSAPGSAVKA